MVSALRCEDVDKRMSERRASMGDKVYRGDVIKFIRDNITLSTFMKRTVKTADEACWDLCDKLNYVPAINEEQHWIPVTERLPKEYDVVLMTVRRNDKTFNQIPYLRIGFMESSRWYPVPQSSAPFEVDIASYDGGETEVIAWKPLPKPYQPDVK